MEISVLVDETGRNGRWERRWDVSLVFSLVYGVTQKLLLEFCVPVVFDVVVRSSWKLAGDNRPPAEEM